MSELESPTSTEDAPKYVGFWVRFLAFVIDSIPVIIILGVILDLALGVAASDIDLANPDWNLIAQRLSIELIVAAAIFIGFWMYFAATPGKMVFGASIVDAKTLGRATTGQLILRYIGYYISMLPLMLGFLWIAFDRRKQGWHDKIGRTVVIKGKPRQATVPE